MIPFEPMWKAFKRIIKPRGAIVLTASQPFTSLLTVSNLEMFKYAWVWKKNNATGFSHATNMPLKNYEDICVFSPAAIGHKHLVSNRMSYNPQGIKPCGKLNRRAGKGFDGTMERKSQSNIYVTEFTNYPRMVLYFDTENDTEHPTQKPVALFEYLIRTYTQTGELVFDPCVGSGTTAIAARNEKRRFIVGDQSPDYVEIARKRLAMPYTPRMFDLDTHAAYTYAGAKPV